MNNSKNFFLGKLAVASLIAMSASAMAQPPVLNEANVFGYSIPSAKIQVVSAETMLAEAPLSFDGSAVVSSRGEATASGQIMSSTPAGNYTVAFAAIGRVGESIPTTVQVNGISRPAVVRIAAVGSCDQSPCPGAVRIRVEGENLNGLEIYLPGTKLAF